MSKVEYIVCWVSQEHEDKCNGFPDVTTDHYEVFEDLGDAQDRYDEIRKQPETWSANVSKIIQSTDYL
jgi:hypothetical protein